MSRYRKELYGDAIVNDFVAMVTGQKFNIRPYAWVDGDHRYSHIAGAVTMPTFEQPGYLMTVGVRYDDQKIEVIEERQSDDEMELIQAALDIQADYGDALRFWYGDPTRLAPLVNQIDARLAIAPFLDHNQDDAYQIYIQRLTMSLHQDCKMLYLRDARILQNAVISFVKDRKNRQDDNPVFSTAGGLMHTLMTARPWEQAVEVLKLSPTRADDVTDYEDRVTEQQAYALLYQGAELT